MNAARAGNVTVANAIGNGIADDKLMYTFVPELITYYLGERPILPNVPTYRLEDPEQLEFVVARIDELVVKPVDGSGGHGLIVGPQASDEELAATVAAIRQRPRDYIAQELVDALDSADQSRRAACSRATSTCGRSPSTTASGSGCCPAASTRVALREGSVVVNSSQGGGSKDTWVLATARWPRAPVGEDGRGGGRLHDRRVPGRLVRSGSWAGVSSIPARCMCSSSSRAAGERCRPC